MSLISRRQLFRSYGLGSLALCAAPAFLSSTLQAEEPHVTVPSYNHLTDEEEIALGQKFATQVERDLPVVHESLIDSYLSGIVRKLAKQSQRPQLPYTIKLINSNTVNAFSLAGGFLYLHRGLAQAMTSEDELVATLGHELGHVVGRHSINGILRDLIAKRVLEKVLDNLFKNNGIVEGVFAHFGGALSMLALLHYSREDELQADMLGFYEMLRAGWDPHGMDDMFALLEGFEQRSGGGRSFPYLSTHPPTPARRAAVKRELAEVTLPRGLRTDSVAFHGFKAILATLPTPPQPRNPQGEGR